MQTEQRFRELLEKYLAGTCSPKEKAMMDEWFEKGGNTSKADLGLSQPSRLRLLDRIHEIQNGQAISRSRSGSKLRSLFTGRYAAAVWTAILISVGIATWKSGIIRPLYSSKETPLAYRMIQTGKGEVKQFRLPDGSTITLNANSRLEYHPQFTDHRHIRLNGEALFSVVRDKAHPFSVETSDSLATTVLGTQFNIQSYDKGQETRITVVSGVVAVHKGQHPLDTITRAQAIRYQKNGQTFTVASEVHTESVTGWTRREWEYDNLRFNDLAILLQNHYGITVISNRNTDLLQTRVSVNFNSRQSAKDILSVFCSFAGCSFREISPLSIEIH